MRAVRVAVPVPLHRAFDYAVPDHLAMPVAGARVLVPFSGRRLVGVALQLNPPDAHASPKPIAAVLDETSVLGDELFELARWMAAYYLHPIGEVLSTLLPAAARKPEPLRI
ncbi:MAG: primosomal protein N', partial [Gammaproteobacteria bacterium]